MQTCHPSRGVLSLTDTLSCTSPAENKEAVLAKTWDGNKMVIGNGY